MRLSRQQRNAVVFLACIVQAGMLCSVAQKQVPAVARFVGAEDALGAIDLNKANFEQFMRIRGIPEKLARRIIAYRQEHGDFQDVAQLQEVKGVGPKRYERIKGLFRVE